MSNMELIQQRLRECIKISGLKQTEIAKKIGISSATLSQYLHNNKFPALDTLSKLCVVLNVSADYILGITDTY